MRYASFLLLVAAGSAAAGGLVGFTVTRPPIHVSLPERLAAPRTLTAPPASSLQPGATQPATTTPPPEVRDQIAFARTLSDAFNHAAKVIGPSVVHVTQLNRVFVGRGFFDPGEARIQPTGLGSGVVISEDGYILTNNHVISGAQSLRVKLSDQREYDARLVGTDPPSDLAVLKIDAHGLTPARFADSDALQIGEWVVAVGSPFGFDNTVTAGIVSATGRVGLQAQTDERYEEFIQTDAAINPGNSGGPLVNLEGHIIGINDQIATRGGGSVGLGFAIPSSIAQPVADAIIRSGRVMRGYAGVRMGEGTTGLLEGGVRGVTIEEVVEGGPAARAGIRGGDVVTSFNNRPVWNSNRLRNTITFTAPGSTVPVELVRDGEPLTVRLSLGEGTRDFPSLGLTVRTLDADVARELRVPDDINARGLVVSRIEPGGPAHRVDLRARDIIVQVNGQDVASVEALERALTGARGTVRLGVVGMRSDGFRIAWQQGHIDVMPR